MILKNIHAAVSLYWKVLFGFGICLNGLIGSLMIMVWIVDIDRTDLRAWLLAAGLTFVTLFIIFCVFVKRSGIKFHGYDGKVLVLNVQKNPGIGRTGSRLAIFDLYGQRVAELNDYIHDEDEYVGGLFSVTNLRLLWRLGFVSLPLGAIVLAIFY